MKFTVQFCTSVTMISTPVCLPPRHLGLDFVDRVREAAGRAVPVEKISSYVVPFNIAPECVLSEEFARKSGLFSQSESAIVTVPKSSLNPFAEIAVVKGPDEWRGEWQVDNRAILRAWEDAGFPLEWNPPSDELRIEVAKARATGKAA